ncbi:cytidine deaminase [Vibrio casei]|uniref:Cytidine deaminase n=1 Tax=Vibrio casei TaxID=673372 RepID=A0A368LNX4_9VIBR|nr:cytidine deaminase [Vibrio casei]RCS73193.1 cytidine deaminase [Vibrio casei]SJN41265.1 Cytidine deaminase [Vibrio casei]
MKPIDSELLNHLPTDVADSISAIMESEHFNGHFTAEQYSGLLAQSALSDTEFKLALLPIAAARAYCSISDFHVGAIAEGNSGAVYFGANIEIQGVQLGQTVHAEQSAISHAWMKGETGLKNITINYTPCGHCRQFMNELNGIENLAIQLPNRPAYTLQDLLPESFGPKDLNIDARLMGKTSQNYQLNDESLLVKSALKAMNMSHAPYTQNHSGVALMLKNGSIFNGSYAENAAFNPSLPPLQVAINLLLLSGNVLKDIDNAVLVEHSQGTISHLAETQSTLEAIDPDIRITYISL